MKRLVVLGAGESGVGAAVLAKKVGFEVFVSDLSEIKDSYKQVLNEYGIQWEEKQHTESCILNADEVVKSPGIPRTLGDFKIEQASYSDYFRDRVSRTLYQGEDDLHYGK